MALFGLSPDAATAQATATGKKARQDLQAGFLGASGAGAGAAGAAGVGKTNDIASSLFGNATVTPESVAPLASSFMPVFGKALTPQKDKNGKSTGIDFGALFAGAINDSLTTTTAFDATGAALLTKITASFKTVSGVDFIGGIVKAFDTNLAETSAINALENVGEKIAQILKTGIANGFKSADVAAMVNNGVNTTTTTTTTTPATTPGNATGTNFWRGGYSRIDERGGEIVDLPRGSRVYPRDLSVAMANSGGGDTHIHVNATVNSQLDIERIAYRVSQIQQRRGR